MESEQRKRLVRIYRAVVLLTLLATTSSVQPQTQADFVKAYVGQRFLLRGQGDKQEIELKKEDLGQYRGHCDLAVEVRDGDFAEGKLQFWLERIGTVVPRGETRVCPPAPAQTKLIISGFDTRVSQSALSAAVGQILQTPESYLASYGVSVEPPTQNPESPLVSLTTRELKMPRPLLMVSAHYPEPPQKKRRKIVVAFEATIGRDGRVHAPRIVRGSSPEFDRRANT